MYGIDVLNTTHKKYFYVSIFGNECRNYHEFSRGKMVDVEAIYRKLNTIMKNKELIGSLISVRFVLIF